MDVFFSFPAVLLALGIVAALGPHPANVVLAIAVVYTPIFARVVRGPVLALKEREFVEASRALGAPARRIVGRHILPNLASVLVVQTSIALSWAILTEASLSFLGLSAQPPTPVVGRDAERGPPEPRARAAPRGVPGPRDHARGPGLQPARATASATRSIPASGREPHRPPRAATGRYKPKAVDG